HSVLLSFNASQEEPFVDAIIWIPVASQHFSKLIAQFGTISKVFILETANYSKLASELEIELPLRKSFFDITSIVCTIKHTKIYLISEAQFLAFDDLRDLHVF
ncbi:MAG: hypothetical protein EZS28_043561, partial [Streblomastix strix]